MEPVLSSPSPVSPLVDLLPLSLGPETPPLSLKELRLLDDPVTAQYTHTLTVTGRLPGLYTCTVENKKPSSDLQLWKVKILSKYEKHMCLVQALA